MKTRIPFGPALVAGLLLSAPLQAQVGDILLPRQPVPVKAPPPPSADIPTPASPVTVGVWSKLPIAERQHMIVASVESILLAASGPDGNTIGIDPSCLAGGTPTDLDGRMMTLAGRAPGIHFNDAVRRLAGCGEPK